MLAILIAIMAVLGTVAAIGIGELVFGADCWSGAAPEW